MMDAMPIGELAYSNAVGTLINEGPITTVVTALVSSDRQETALGPWFAQPSQGVLQYLFPATITQYFHVAFSVSCSCAVNNKVWRFEIEKSLGGAGPWTVQSTSPFWQANRSTTQFAVAFHTAIQLGAGIADRIRIVVTNETDATQLTIYNVNLVAMGTMSAPP